MGKEENLENSSKFGNFGKYVKIWKIGQNLEKKKQLGYGGSGGDFEILKSGQKFGNWSKF